MTVPRLPRTLIILLAPEALRSQIDGDLREGFLLRTERDGHLKARRWYWRQLISVDVWRLRRIHGQRNRPPPRRRSITLLLHEVSQDTRFGMRTLIREPLFAVVVLVTLSIGIGANTAIFTIVNSVLLRPLGYEKPEDIVMVFRTVPRFGFARSSVSYPDFLDWRARSETLSAMAAYGYTTVNYREGEVADRWQGFRVTGNLFPILGVPPLLGRVVSDPDDVPNGPNVVVLSHGLWQSQFGSDPEVLGRPITLNGEPATVIGIMPSDFDFPSGITQFWTPLQGDRERLERDTNFLTVIGRLGTGRSLEQAQAEMTSVAARIDAEAPDANRDYGVFVERRHDYVVRDARIALWVFMGAVAFVLVIALSNVGNLMLARGTTRNPEIAVRAALGATRPRLIRQFLVESTMLSVVGGALGLGVAVFMLRMFATLGSGQLPRLDQIRLDTTAMAFAVGLSVVAGILFGTLPAIFGSRPDVQNSIRDRAGDGWTGNFGSRVQHGLVVAEIALAVALTIGAGLLINSFARLTSVEPGFDPSNIVVARVAPPSPEMGPGVSADGMAEAMGGRQEFFRDLLARTNALPGVAAAALSYGMPFGGYTFSRVVQPEGFIFEEGDEPVVDGDIVSAGFFRAMGIPIAEGRPFAESDVRESPSVAIINHTMAEMFWPDQEAVGKRFRVGSGDAEWTTVVGIVGNVIRRSLSEDPGPSYYRPHTQAQWPDGMFVVMRSNRSAIGLIAALREEVRQLIPHLPVTDVATAAELLDTSVASPRFRTAVLAVFSGIAVVLAFVGIYGVMSFTVGLRKREIGIRIALGAAQGGVLRMVLRRGLVLALMGVVLGLAGALALTRFLNNMLFNLTTYDPLTYVTGIALVVVTCLVAAYGPARRAAATDPLTSLRYD